MNNIAISRSDVLANLKQLAHLTLLLASAVLIGQPSYKWLIVSPSEMLISVQITFYFRVIKWNLISI